MIMEAVTRNQRDLGGKFEIIAKEAQSLKFDVLTLRDEKKGTFSEISNNFLHLQSGVTKYVQTKRGLLVLTKLK